MFSKILLLTASAGFISAARVARDSGYGAPEVSSYGAPEPAYAEPVVEEYSAPAYTAEGEVLDIGSLVLPILVIVALFLLFPNYINLTTVRRSFNDNGHMGLLDQVKDVAQAVLEDKNILTKYD